MSTNEPKTGSIASIIKEIEKGSIELPNFQRDFVWDVEKSYELFDSIVKDIFIGVLIFGSPSFEIQVRAIEKRERGEISKKKTKRPSRNETTNYTKEQIEIKVRTEGYKLLLDGQQRVTSLYRALMGIDKVWMILNPTSDEELKRLMEIPLEDNFLEHILFKFNGKEDEERPSILISELYKIYNNSYSDRQLKEEFLVGKKFYKKESAELHLDFFRKSSEAFKRILAREKIISYYLLDMSISKFALFFERSNSLGVQLSFIDILTAKIFDGFNLRESIEEFNGRNDLSIVPETIVRAISFYVSGQTETQKSYILKELNTSHFIKYWDVFAKYFLEAYQFLYDNHLLVSTRWLAYENIIIPLIVFRNEVNKPFSEINQDQLEFIINWYWFSIFSARYSGSTNEIIVSDSITLKKIAKQDFDFSKKEHNLYGLFKESHIHVTTYEDLYEIEKPTNAIYRGFLNLLYFENKRLLNWQNSGNIGFSDSQNVHDHHIFPKGFLKKSTSDFYEFKNSVVNRTLIPRITNLKIGDMPPSKYFEIIRKSNSKFDECLSNHLIEIEGDDFEKFLANRAKKLYGLLAKTKENILKFSSKIGLS